MTVLGQAINFTRGTAFEGRFETPEDKELISKFRQRVRRIILWTLQLSSNTIWIL
jgi:hypothetical protein